MTQMASQLDLSQRKISLNGRLQLLDLRFKSELFHPNIYPDGRVCISILHPPGADPMGYESSSERWSPVQSIEKILLSVMSMLAEPNTESPANVDAAKMWREDRMAFKKKACQAVRKSLDMQ